MKYIFKNKLNIVLISIFDFLGSLLAFPFRLSKKKCPENVKNILVTRLDHIGDFISTTPLFENIKAHFTQAKVIALINPTASELAKDNPYIDEIILFTAPWFSRGEVKSGIIQILQLIRYLKRKKIDLGIDPRGDLFSIILMFFSGVKYRAGYGITGAGFLLNKEAEYNKKLSAPERNLEVLKALGIPIKSNACGVYINEKEKVFISTLLRGLNYNKDKAIVLHPYAGTKAKEWGVPKFQELIKALKLKGWDIFVIGSNHDEPAYDNVHDLRGRLTLSQSAALMRQIGRFIGLDSGPANIAAALNISAIILCSGTNIPQEWIPGGSKTRLIYKDVDCKPCELTVCPEKGHYCMDSITAEEIMVEVERL